MGMYFPTLTQSELNREELTLNMDTSFEKLGEVE